MLAELIPEEKRKLFELEQKIKSVTDGDRRWTVSDLLFEHEQAEQRMSYLETLLGKEPRNRVEDYRRRLTSLRNALQHAKQTIQSSSRRSAFDQDRDRLLGNATYARPADDLAMELAENGSLTRSSQMVNQYLETGRESLNELISQRERLKAVQRRVLDIFNYLGLSNTLMRGIENREEGDRRIVIIGIVLVLGLIAVVYFFVRRK